MSSGASRPTNRLLLNREVVWEWREEWPRKLASQVRGKKILADFNAEFKNFFLMREPAFKAGELRERESLCMSELLNKGRTFFRKKEKF